MSTLLEEYESQMSSFHQVQNPLDRLDIQCKKASQSLPPLLQKKLVQTGSQNRIEMMKVSNKTVAIYCGDKSTLYFYRGDKANASTGECVAGESLHSICIDTWGKHILAAGFHHLYHITTATGHLSILPYCCETYGSVVAGASDPLDSDQAVNFLLATHTGKLILLKMEFEGNVRTFCSFKEVFQFDKSEEIVDVKLESVENTPNSVVLVLTNSRLYYFANEYSSSKVQIDDLFASYLTQDIGNYKEFPRGKGGLCTARSPNDFSIIVAWMTEAGILKCELEMQSKLQLVRNQIIAYPSIDRNDQDKSAVSLALTSYHLFVLCSNNCVYVVSILSERLVGRDLFLEKYGSPVALVRDSVAGTMWVHSYSTIFRYKIVGEDRDQWKFYLSENKFAEALNYCKNDVQRRVIKSAQADYMWKCSSINEEYVQCLVQSEKTFEECTLNLTKLDDKRYLQMYLLEKLKEPDKQDKVKIKTISIWIIRLCLSFRIDGASENADLEEFQKLLLNNEKLKAIVSECKNEVYQLALEYGDLEFATQVGKIIGDHSGVIELLMKHNMYKDAAEYLALQADSKLFYQFCNGTELLTAEPDQIFTAWKDMGPFFDVRRVLKGLMVLSLQCDDQMARFLIDYLEHAVYELNEPDPDVHSLLVSLYVRNGSYDKLDEYLSGQCVGQKARFDEPLLLYSLRKAGKFRILHKVYIALGRDIDAVKAALQYDITEAINLTERIEVMEERKKALFLIAEHIRSCQKDNDVLVKVLGHLARIPSIEPTQLLSICPDWLRKEDLQQVLGPVFDRLYSDINQLRQNERSRQARGLSADMCMTHRILVQPRASAVCAQCRQTFEQKQAMIVFACGHVFHGEKCVSATDRCPHCLPALDELHELITNEE